MSASARLRVADIRTVYQLVWECRELGDDPVAWRRHWFAGLARLTGADLAFGGEFAGCLRGRARALGMTGWDRHGGLDRDAWARALIEFAAGPSRSEIQAAYLARLRREDGVAAARTEL